MPDEPIEILRKYERLKALYNVISIIHSTLEPSKALYLIVEKGVRLINASAGSVILVNPANGFLEIESSFGLPAKAKTIKLRIGEGITGWVAQNGKAARVGDVSKDRRYVMLRQNIRSEMAAPIFVNEEVKGVLNVDSDRADAFSDEDQQLLEALAGEASRVIQNTWLYEQLRQKANLFQALISVSRAINSTLNLDEALPLITRYSRDLMNASMSSLLLLDDAGEWLDLRACDGAGRHYLDKPRIAVNDSLVGVVVKRRKYIQVENVQQSSLYQHTEVARREGLVSLLSVPLIFQGTAIGVLNVYTNQRHQFSNEEIQILTAFAELSAIAIQKSRLYQRLMNLEEQLRRSERLSLLGLIAAEVAHEIRNPLTVMKLLYHSLNLQFPENDPRSRDVEIIGKKMDDLNKIVERMLDFARKDEIHFYPVKINDLLEELILLVRQRLSERGIKLVRKFNSDLPNIPADRVQLEQAFLNLILNASDAMPGGGTLTIGTSKDIIKSGIEYICVEFKDSGEGMTEEVKKRAFESLFSSAKKEGAGLGLAIVKRIVEAHNGKIEINSAKGKGATIKIYLPLNEQ